MGLSTYMRASKGFYQALDAKDYDKIADVLEDIVPLDLGEKHNATRNIEIQIPIATWHKAYTMDGFLWSMAGEPDSDEYGLTDADLRLMIDLARSYVDSPSKARRYDVGVPEESNEWISQQFLRLERALTDVLLSGKLQGWTLKVWRSY